MNLTKKFEDVVEKKMIDTNGLRAMLSAGRQTAVKIGMDAGARVQVGRRVLWNVEKIQNYLDEISGK